MISALIAPVLQKLAAICRQVLNGSKHRTFLLPGVAPACVKGRAPAGRRKARIRELGDNAYSVRDTPCPEREKPPPLACASP
jgi:hypothetical protein